jgi:hypothetical protein
MKSPRGLGIRVRIVGLALTGLAAGCGSSSGGSTTISSQPLSGKLGGQPWTLMTGVTNSFLSTSSTYWVDAYAESFTPCTGSASSNADEIIMNLPMAVGNYTLSRSLNQTFYVATTGDNLIATSGEVDITDVSATTITGGAKFAYDGNNSVDGQFEMTICP